MSRPGDLSPRLPPPRTPQRGRPLVTACAWCRKVRDLGGRWVAAAPPPRHCEVSHGLCQPCATALLLDLDAEPVQP